MHERMYPYEALLHPETLTRMVSSTKQINIVATAPLPYPLSRIMSRTNETEKYDALYTAITNHLWSAYEPLWSAATKGIKLEEKSFTTKAIARAKKIAESALIGKVTEGPLAPLIIATNIALSIPRALAEAFGTQSKPPTTTDRDIVLYVQLLDAMGRELRRSTHDPSKEVTVSLSNESGETVTITMPPHLQNALLSCQEEILSQYRPFFNTTPANESYERYIKQLILPRLMYHIIPEYIREKNDITLANVATKIKSFGTYFDRTLTALQAVTSLLAVIHTLEKDGIKPGNYVALADSIDTYA